MVFIWKLDNLSSLIKIRNRTKILCVQVVRCQLTIEFAHFEKSLEAEFCDCDVFGHMGHKIV